MAAPSSPGRASFDSSVPTSSCRGETAIYDVAVARVVGIAARDVSGVHALGDGATRPLGAAGDAVTPTDLNRSVSVEVGASEVGGTEVAADVAIVAEYPVALREVAERVRSAVIRDVEGLVGMPVTEVNVDVDDVHLSADDTDDNSEDGVQ